MWDFDGVIKDSVEVKGSIFADIFPSAPQQIREKILRHHSCNGGLSRYKKIPLYMMWCRIPESRENIKKYLVSFSSQSIDKVVSSAWVEGVESHLKTFSKSQRFYIVSATPADELTHIVEKLRINDCFLGIFGSPASKKQIILEILNQETAAPSDAVFIGDSQIDHDSAAACGVPFILRGQPGITISSAYSLETFL